MTSILKPLGPKYFPLSLPFHSTVLRFAIPIKWSPQIFENLEHVLIECDYFQFPSAVPQHGHKVLDVGAFVGFYTIASAYLVGTHGRVYAIEPNPEALTALYTNIKLNNLSNVVLYPIAISDKHGTCPLYVGRYGAVSSLLPEHTSRYTDIESQRSVKCITMSALLRSVGSVDILKIDVEGAEYSILKEARDELWRARTLVVEVHTHMVDPSDLEHLLYSLGFPFITMYISSDMPEQVIVYATRNHRDLDTASIDIYATTPYIHP